ncbi:MAG: branched-chain amino acid ABC transporter permease [Acidobacteriota bacterium]
MAARRRVGAVLALLSLGVFLLLPRLVGTYTLLTLTRLLLLALMAIGWNFVGGFAGYASFGNAAFFGVGAYATGLLMLSSARVPFLPALACGALLCAGTAALLGLPILRLKGHYFAIATLGVAEAARQIADTWDGVTQGSTGIDLPMQADGTVFYWTALALVVGGTLLTARLARSKVGYAWMAIREDEDAARTAGIPTTRYKVLAYALSAAFSGLAGGITAYQNVHVTPTDFFKLDYTLESIIAVVIGGAGTVFGPVIGAAVFELLSTFVWSHFLELHPTVLGLLIIFFVVFVPRGIVSVVGAVRARRGRGLRWRDLFANIRENRVT